MFWNILENSYVLRLVVNDDMSLLRNLLEYSGKFSCIKIIVHDDMISLRNLLENSHVLTNVILHNSLFFRVVIFAKS